jgi:hypothetical protein
MPKPKTMSITTCRCINFIPTSKDLEPLAYFEEKIRRERRYKDCNDVSNADIIRHILHGFYDICKRKK